MGVVECQPKLDSLLQKMNLKKFIFTKIVDCKYFYLHFTKREADHLPSRCKTPRWPESQSSPKSSTGIEWERWRRNPGESRRQTDTIHCVHMFRDKNKTLQDPSKQEFIPLILSWNTSGPSKKHDAKKNFKKNLASLHKIIHFKISKRDWNGVYAIWEIFLKSRQSWSCAIMHKKIPWTKKRAKNLIHRNFF